MDLRNTRHIYFLGIGGIGMSALARYFHRHGVKVEGYDRASTLLTTRLQQEGIAVHYDDMPEAIPTTIDLVIYTPAIPSSLKEYKKILENGTPLVKRAEVLGWLSRTKKCIAVAGTHGKTTTSTMIAHLLHQSDKGCLAFLGGISKNYDTNLIDDNASELMIAEADEFDRSFLQLLPALALITSVDPDHLDIYGNHESMKEAFSSFIGQIVPGGTLLIKEDLNLNYSLPAGVKRFTYGFQETSDYHPVNIKIKQGTYYFDFVTPLETVKGFSLTIPGHMNLENASAAMAVCQLNGLTLDRMKDAVSSYQGVVRRMDKKFDNQSVVYIDDYAHHPGELTACIQSIRMLYPGKKVCGVFQPHLFSRTRDFVMEFAKSLENLDEVIILDIYPAREEPIPGINSAFLLGKIRLVNKMICNKENLAEVLKARDLEVLLTLGAGDIDQLVEPIVSILQHKYTA